MATFRHFRSFSKRHFYIVLTGFIILTTLLILKDWNVTKSTKPKVKTFDRYNGKATKSRAEVTSSMARKEAMRDSSEHQKHNHSTYNLVIVIKNSKANPSLHSKFETLLGSIYKMSSISLCFHVISDGDGETIAKSVIRRIAPKNTRVHVYFSNL